MAAIEGVRLNILGPAVRIVAVSDYPNLRRARVDVADIQWSKRGRARVRVDVRLGSAGNVGPMPPGVVLDVNVPPARSV
jgi:hypothetical protein